MKIPVRFDALFRRKAMLWLAGMLCAIWHPTHSAQAATVVFDGGPGATGTVLSTAANWVGDVPPGTSSEVLLDNSVITLPAQLTTASITFGDLIWNSNVSSAITIDSAGASNVTLTLSGGAGSTEAIAKGGATGDLIVMGTAATTSTLSIGGNAGLGTARLNMSLGASGSFNVVGAGATLSISSAISGSGMSLAKNGAGTLTLTGSNSFGGSSSNFTLNAGTLNINGTSVLGASSNTFILNGGTFDNTSGAALVMVSYKQIWNNNVNFTGTNSLNMGAGTISLGTAAGTSRTVTVSASTLTLGGAISAGTTASSIIKDGAGTLVLTGSNTYTGGALVKNGSVLAGSSTVFGPVATGGAVTLGDTSGSNNASILGTGVSGITLANAIVVASGSSGNTLTLGSGNLGGANTTFSGTISLGHDLNLANNTNNLTTFSGVISQTGGTRAITVNAGVGTIVVSGNNTFTGGVTLNNGRLQVGITNSTGTGPLTILGGAIDNASTSSSSAATLNNSSYAWNADFTFSGSTHVTMATGNVTINGNRTLTTNAITAAVLTVSGGISDGGSGYSFTKAGPGTLTLNGASTYSGATFVTRGILNLTGASSSLASTSAVTVSGGTLNLGVTSGTGVANRINSAASLSLGGNAIFMLNAGATAPVNSQSFVSLSVLGGSSQLSTSSTGNAGTFSFMGPAESVYSRALGGTLRIVVGTNTSFTNAPTGSGVIGSGASAILIGAVTGTAATASTMTDFVKAGAGVVSLATYGTNVWASGTNTNVMAPLTVTGDTQSLRFNLAGSHAVTLTGTSTLESGGILVTSNAVAGGVITGGQLQAASGKDLWIYSSTAAANSQGLKIGSLIADNAGSSLTKTGPGTVYLTNAGNTYAGGTYLGEGILNVTSGGALGTGPLNFTGTGTLQAGAATVDLGTRTVTIGSGQTATFNTNGSANTVTVSGVISGVGGLTKTGAGTLVLSAANTYSGTTAVENGTLKLDFTPAGAPTDNILPAGSLLSPGVGNFQTPGASSQTVLIQGRDNTANSQTFGGTYTNVLGGFETAGIFLNRGMSHLNLVAGSGGTLTVNVGAISRGFTTEVNNILDISIGAGVTVLTSTVNGTVLGQSITVNSNTWAQVTNGQIVPFTAYSTSYSIAAAQLDAGSGGTLSANPNSLRFNNAGDVTVAPGVGVVRSISSGGVLVTSNVGAGTSVIGSGIISGYSSRDIIFHQHNTAGDLQVNAAIVDAGARTMSVSKTGLGRMIMSGANTYTGNTFVDEGTLLVTSDATASFTRAATSAASSPTLTVSDTSGMFIGQTVTGPGLAGSSITWTIVAISPDASVTLSSNADTISAGGTFTFGASGALGAGASTAHYIASGATLQIGNGGSTGSLLPGQTLANNGIVDINRSSDLTFANAISGTGALEKHGAGNVTLTAASTFTGDTRIAGGSLILSTVASNLLNSTLDYNTYGGSLSFGTLTAASFGGLKGSQNLALTNAATVPAAVTLTVGGNHQDTEYSGSLSGLGSLSKTGGGTLTLSGASTNAGTLSVSQGTLNLTGSYGGTTYLSANGLTVTGGVLNVTGTMGISAAVPLGQTAFSGNSITNFSGTEFLAGNSATFRVGQTSSATVNVTAGTLTIGSLSGGVVLGREAATASGFLNVSGGSFVVTGAYSVRVGAGFADAEDSGASAVTISGTGNFDTGTTSGLFLLGSNRVGNSASTGTINLDGGTLTTNRSITGGTVGGSIVNLNGGTFKAAGTAATLATSLTTVNVRDGGAVINTNTYDIAIAEPLLHSTIVGDNATDGGLTKQGTGTLALSGVSTYTGATTINAGNLQVGVAGVGRTGTGATSVNGSGAVLSGTGMVQGSTSVILGQIRPGDTGGTGEGTLTFSSGLAFTQATPSTAAALTIQGTTTANETGDRISITGALTLDADSTFTISSGASWTPTENQSWTLMDWSGLLALNSWSTGSNLRTGSNAAGNEGNLDLPDLTSYGLNWNISTLLDGTTGGSLTISIVNLVPEPSRALLALMGTACVLLRRRGLPTPAL